jgi:hypothetical protein
MNTKFFFLTALIVGLLTALLSSIPILSLVNCLLCGWLWMGGIFGVWLYRYFTNQTLDMGRGALLGLVGGIIGAVVSTLLGLLFKSAGALSPEQIQQMEEVFGESAKIFQDPAAIATIGLVVSLVLFPVFTAIGGLIGAAIFKPKPAV